MRCVLVLIALTACPVVLGAADESPPILITRQLAEREHLQVGDVVHLVPAVGQTAARAFRIAGVYEPTPDPGRLGAVRHEAQLHLQDLLDLTRDPSTPVGSERVSTINVRLITPAEAPAFARDVAARTPGVSARPTAASADAAGPFVVLERFHLAIAIVTIIASTVFLLALTIMLVDERRATVGVLRLIGLPTHRILAQLFVEGSLVRSEEHTSELQSH